MGNSEPDGNDLFLRQPFSALVETDERLRSARSEYASRSKSDRRMAADWEYHSEAASEIFEASMERAGREGLGRTYWPAGVMALAIDPLYAPAILTVGSIEYQVRRVDEAMDLFLGLARLPEDEEDLAIIIDKAGDFLIDNGDFRNALLLYEAAEKSYPNESVYPLGAGYCLGKLGDMTGAVERTRRAVALEPDNHEHLNDLGFSLLEAGEMAEAEQILERAVALAPDDYELARGNLEELRKRRG